MSLLNNLKSINHLVAKLIVEELYRHDITTYAISPGARSIPMTYAINEHEKAEIKLFNDERSAAFWAQGYAKVSDTPVVLLATSGTAIANYLPGVIEAYYSGLPLIIVTCDRPWELQQAKANQTIEQNNIFNDFTKLKIQIPAIEKKFFPESILANIDQAIFASKNLPAGPVHINLSFRKPFEIAGFSSDNLDQQEVALVKSWEEKKQVFCRYMPSELNLAVSDNDFLINKINSAKKPLIVVGPLKASRGNSGIVSLADKLNAPILADINSNLRFSGSDKVVSLYNTYLRNSDYNQLKEADLVLCFGDRIISESLREFFEELSSELILINDYPLRQDAIENEFINITHKIFAEPDKLAAGLSYKVDSKSDSDYLESFLELEELAQATLIPEDQQLMEASALCQIVESIEEDSLIYFSSSLILREAENFIATQKKNVLALCNRGVVGIDGVLSSACGAAAASNKKVYLFIGDQALLHDLTALNIAKELNIHVFLLNNSGGAIFNILDTPDIEEILLNPQSVDFQKVVESFACNYSLVKTREELASRMQNLSKEMSLTEIQFSPSDSAKQLNSIQV